MSVMDVRTTGLCSGGSWSWCSCCDEESERKRRGVEEHEEQGR